LDDLISVRYYFDSTKICLCTLYNMNVSFSKKIYCKLFRLRFLCKINNRITSVLYTSISICINWMGLAWNVIRCFRRAFLCMKKDINKGPWLGTFFGIFSIGFIVNRLNTFCTIRLNGIKRAEFYLIIFIYFLFLNNLYNFVRTIS